MTNTEAIQTLEVMSKAVEWDYPIEWQVAIDMAIKALKEDMTCQTCWHYDPPTQTKLPWCDKYEKTLTDEYDWPKYPEPGACEGWTDEGEGDE